jgi:Family of unknown function (DUF5996)
MDAAPQHLIQPREGPWPELPLAAWRDTCVGLHMCTQIIGKIRLALTPKANQWWNVPLYLTARGLTTSPMPTPTPRADRTLSIDLDFIDHAVIVADSDGLRSALPLRARSVAEFHRELFDVLGAMGIRVSIRPRPVECPLTTPFLEQTEVRPYDPVYAHRFWLALKSAEPVLERFRARFRGKCSPVHFFWGSFDLAVTRFNGRRAPPTGMSIIDRDAYDEECISVGFWPGDEWNLLGDPPIDASFYAYAVPRPAGFEGAIVRPADARYDERLKEFLLPYDAVRRSADPAVSILEFAQSTYDAAARLAGWDVRALAYP